MSIEDRQYRFPLMFMLLPAHEAEH